MERKTFIKVFSKNHLFKIFYLTVLIPTSDKKSFRLALQAVGDAAFPLWLCGRVLVKV